MSIRYFWQHAAERNVNQILDRCPFLENKAPQPLLALLRRSISQIDSRLAEALLLQTRMGRDNSHVGVRSGGRSVAAALRLIQGGSLFGWRGSLPFLRAKHAWVKPGRLL